jgi:hypothetical protein
MITATEARQLCPPSTTEQVFDDITSRAKVGGTELTMRSVLLRPETRQLLFELGYSVRDGAGPNGDLTVISW